MRRLKRITTSKRQIARTVDVELMRTVQVIPIAGCSIIGK